MSTNDESLIKDTDLRKELARHRGRTLIPKMFELEVKLLIEEQERRDAAAEARAVEIASLPRDKGRRAKARDMLETSKGNDAQNLRHIHSVLALCGLPYTKKPIEERTYQSEQGRMKLLIKAGELLSPQGEWVPQPLPYGSRARLLLLHLCSEAIRQKSPTINIEDSLTAFLNKMGFEATGGPRGTLTAFKQQVNALAACNMKIGMTDGAGHATTINTQPFASLDVWFPQNPDQRMLWPSTITFSRDFYDTLSKHALPVNVHAIRAFSGSPRKIDIYYWLSHRIYGLEEPLMISWSALKEQFGDGYSRERDFRAKFAEELKHIGEVFPKLPASLGEKGLKLKPADAQALAIPAKRSTKIPVKP
ncbi:replication protein RepA [Agrobacterium sp. ES01]|uniref:replication protein RepA n=1 Tax=Agrobacterium sp. ES01 TaxID=3420714 RepID=UPI003D09EC34